MLDVLRKRRSVRKYKNTSIEKEKIEILKEALLRAPSGRTIRPWEFYFVYDKQKINALSKAKAHGSELLEGAPLAVVIVADPSKTDVWIEDCSIAAIILQLAAEEQGLGTCWVQIRLRQTSSGESSDEYVKKLLNIDTQKTVASIIAIGYPDESPRPWAESSLKREKIVEIL